MATEHNQEGNQQNSSGVHTSRVAERVVAKYHELKEHAQTYPYVWASYAVVYGGFGLWYAYRWRKLRRTEDRVRVLQQSARERRQADEAVSTNSSASATSEKPSGTTRVDKPPK